MYLFGVFALLICLKFIMVKKSKFKPDQESSPKESSWVNWTKSSAILLSDAEKKILSSLRTPYRGKYVDIGSIVGENDRIWTLCFNEASQNVPIVLVHGMGAGAALWVMNLDEIAADRPVYAIDLLGFGRSSRPNFGSDSKVVELQLIAFLEEWRRNLKLERFILLGHSLGGYISSLYTMQYPERIQHLILADPWGLNECPENLLDHYKVPMWVRALFHLVKLSNPLWGLRAAGPLGEKLVSKLRHKLVSNFTNSVVQAEKVIPQYLHQCNNQKPSGESAFHALMHMFIFAKNPLIHRLGRLHQETRMTLIYGAKSWVDNKIGPIIKERRNPSEVDIHIIPKAGHHIYIEEPELFNKVVTDVCHCEDARNS